jgi:hypothetical protein
MTDLPRLELTGENNKNNEYIIYRNKSSKKKGSIKKMKHSKTRKIRKRKKGLFKMFF